jgi:hypothetical protein
MKKNEFVSWLRGFMEASDIELSDKKWDKILDTLNKVVEEPKKIKIDEDGDGVADGWDVDGDGKIDEYFAHRNCQHVWGDTDNDGELECINCGLLKESRVFEL